MTRIPSNWGRNGHSGEYGMGLLWFLIGAFCGATIAVAGLYSVTDQDTPVALEPKCETIIIHRWPQR